VLTHGDVTQEDHWESASGSWLTVKHGYDSGNPGTCVNTGVGNPTYTTDARGNSTVYSYDAQNLYITQIVQAYGTPDARTFTFQHDSNSGLLTQKFDADHSVTTNLDYDQYGRNKMIAENGVRTTRTIYDDSLRTIVVKSDLNTNDDGALLQTTYYDQLGRARLTQDAAGNKVQQGYYVLPNNGISYELVSNPFATLGDSTMGSTRTARDANGRVIEVQHFSGGSLPAPWGSNTTSTGTATTSYAMNCATSADEVGVSRTSCVDGLGRMTSVVENGISATTSYGYDALDNLTSVIQGSTTRGFTYSSLKRLLTASNPESGTISYSYDANGNLYTRTDARGTVTTYYPASTALNSCYNGLDQVRYKQYSDTTPPVTYTYNKSWLAQVQSSASTYSYVFDPLGRVKGGTQTTPTTGGQSYTFGANLKPTVGILSITYPNSGRVVTTGYDSGGRPTTLAGQIGTNAPTNYVTATSYQPHGAIAQQTLGNGLVVTRCNGTACDNARLQPTYISAGNLLSITYGYSAAQNNGNLLSQTITRGSQTWVDAYTSYDGANRLKSASESNAGTWSQNLCYDNLGNRWLLSYPGLPAPTLETPQGADCNSPPYGSNNRITGWGYDAAGNVTTSGTGRTFIYDAENRQTSATVNGQTTTYKYDGDGRRITKVAPSGTTVFVYDPFGNLAQEYGPSTDSGLKYITTDHLGSTRLVTDSSGAAWKCYDYLPFGEELGNGTGGRGNCFGGSQYPTSPDVLSTKFTAKERDAETGLDYFQTRYFSSAQGRYTSQDPLMASARPSNPQTWNRYAYGLNNPLRYIDPDGMAEISVEDCRKDSKCTVVNLNVIQDKNANNGNGLTANQMKDFNNVLQGAKDDLGNGNIALNVTYTSGEVTSSGVSGLNSSAANVFLSSYVPTSVTGNAFFSGSLNGQTVTDRRANTDVMFISANNAQTGLIGSGIPYAASFTNTVTHEFLHFLSGDPSRRGDNDFTKGWHEFQIDRQASGLHLDINYIRPEQLQRAKTYSSPVHPDAVKPGK